MGGYGGGGASSHSHCDDSDLIVPHLDLLSIQVLLSQHYQGILKTENVSLSYVLWICFVFFQHY